MSHTATAHRQVSHQLSGHYWRAVAGRPRDVEKRENIRAGFMDPKNAGIGMNGMIALTGARGEMVRAVRDDLLAAGAISRDALKRETAESRARAALLAAPERTNAKLAGETGLPVHAFSNARAKCAGAGRSPRLIRVRSASAFWPRGGMASGARERSWIWRARRRDTSTGSLAALERIEPGSALENPNRRFGILFIRGSPSRAFNNVL